MMFRDQVGVLAGWFKGWNECEQTVALLSLLKRVSQTQARFLQLCLEHSLADCAELHVLEGEANSPGKCAAAAVPPVPPFLLPPSPPASQPRAWAPPPVASQRVHRGRGPGPLACHPSLPPPHPQSLRPLTSAGRFGFLPTVNSFSPFRVVATVA